VLVLPIWLLLLSLMVLIGVTGAWRVRGQAVAREAAVRSLWPNTRQNDPAPDEWFPDSARMELRQGDVSPVFGDDPLSGHAVVRGPLLVDPATGARLEVSTHWWSVASGGLAGRATLDHDAAVWRRSGYRHRVVREFPVLDGFAGQQHAIGANDRPPARSREFWGFDPAAW
jgi:hypothetical protein